MLPPTVVRRGLPPEPRPRFRGFLRKKCATGLFGRRWVRRYFVLERGRLEFFNVASPQKAERHVGDGREIKLVWSSSSERQRRGSYTADEIVEDTAGADVRDGPHRKHEKRSRHPFHFFLVTPDRTWQLSAESERQKQQFMSAIKATVDNALGRGDNSSGKTTATAAAAAPINSISAFGMERLADDPDDSSFSDASGTLGSEDALRHELDDVIDQAHRAVLDTYSGHGIRSASSFQESEGEFEDCDDAGGGGGGGGATAGPK
jgi:hypothetical protein